jgi:hypothetical protein
MSGIFGFDITVIAIVGFLILLLLAGIKTS